MVWPGFGRITSMSGLSVKSFVDIAFHAGVQRGPCFFIDQVGYEPLELGGVLDSVLRFAEDGSEHAWYFAEVFEGVAKMPFERDAVEFEQTGPVIFFGNDGGLVFWRLRSRVC